LSARGFRRERTRRIAAEARRAQLRRRRAGLLAAVATGAFALAAPAAQAANFEVNTLTDASADGCAPSPGDCTLREAITAAGANSEADVITFKSGLTGTLTLASQLQTTGTVVDDITIQGPGAGAITISGDNDNNGPDAGDSRILYVLEPSTGAVGTSVAISGLTLSGGDPASGAGGAIYLGKYTHLNVDHMTISGNTSSASGGGIGSAFPKYTEIAITDSTISGNSAIGGGGVSTFGPLTIDHSTLSGNHATGGAGGAIVFGQKYGPLAVTDSVLSGNTAANGGGAISSSPTTGGPFEYGPTDNTVSDTTIAGNSASVQGGALALYGLASDDGSFTIDHSTIAGNHATNTTSYGGGVATQGTFNGKVSVVDSTVSGNDAGVGAGISIRSQSQVGPNGSISADNSTIASNTAIYEGGGMWDGSTGPSGGPYVSPPVGVNSTIVGDNTAGLPSGPDDLGRADLATSGGFQLSFSLVEAPTDAVDTQASSITGADPQLAGLADNGGPTLTQLPALSSPATDAGNNPLALTTDQRGQPRTIDQSAPNGGDGTDIGAVELSVPGSNPPPATKKKCKKHKKKKHSASTSKKKKKCKKKKKRH
jgi:CSLREA domain-containing protein